MLQSDRWTDAVIDNRKPMEPIPTDIVPRLSKLSNIRAVVLDIYGTLVISGSGDVGSVVEIECNSKPAPTATELQQQIQRMNDDRRSSSCPNPEVDVVEAWRRTLGSVEPEPGTKRVVQMAAEFESRVNPTWPMPGAGELLSLLERKRVPLGIVSNAQVFTIPLVEDLLAGKELAAGGFDLDLCIFSNRFRHAKPGQRLFDVLHAALARRGIEPAEAIYVGNDMLNDVWSASQAGLKTAWFAGDARSCRRRKDDHRCRSLMPDLILTKLMQLPECLQLK